jgi:hypothetical protein
VEVTTAAPLPVQLVSFAVTISREGPGAKLEWQTVSEVHNFGFYIQRKGAGDTTFTEIANSFVEGHNTTTRSNAYTFVDLTLHQAGTYHYRLRQVDLDGSVHFSDSREVTVSQDAIIELAPRVFSLLQNYPNPFNPETRIKFCVEQTSATRLQLFDVTGRLVRTLFDDRAEAGRYYIVPVNGSNLATGAYYYVLRSADKKAVGKMLMIR